MTRYSDLEDILPSGMSPLDFAIGSSEKALSMFKRVEYLEGMLGVQDPDELSRDIRIEMRYDSKQVAARMTSYVVRVYNAFRGQIPKEAFDHTTLRVRLDPESFSPNLVKLVQLRNCLLEERMMETDDFHFHHSFFQHTIDGFEEVDSLIYLLIEFNVR